MSLRCLLPVFVLFLTARSLLAGGLEPLKTLRVMEIENVEGAVQHLAADVKGQRIFVVLSGKNSVEVLDVKNFKHLATISGLSEPQDIAFDASANRIYITNGGDGSLRTYDGTSLKLLDSKFTGGDAGPVKVLGNGKGVLVGYGVGGMALFDGQTGQRSEIKLKSHAEAFQAESHGTRIYVSLPGIGQIGVIDRPSRTMVDVWHMEGCKDFGPMAIDEDAKRMFVVCRRPAKLLVLDMDDGRVVTAKPTVGDVDNLFFDAERKRIYVIGGEGSVAVFQQKSADSYTALQKYDTTTGGRTGLFVPEWKRLFVAARNNGPFAAELIVFGVED